MKKFISLALAAAMTLSLVPVSAFAATDNRISNVVTVQKEDVLGTDVTGSIPEVVIVNDKGDIKSDLSFELQLDGAEWDAIGNVEVFELDSTGTDKITDVDTATNNLVTEGKVSVEKISSTKALVTVDVNGTPTTSAGLRIVLKGVKVTGDTAKVTINPKNSTISADTFTFAKASDGATITTVDGTKDFYDGGDVKDIFIEEVTTGTLEHGKKVTLKLNSGFKFGSTTKVSIVSGDGNIQIAQKSDGTGAAASNVSITPSASDNRTLEFYIWDADTPSVGTAITSGQSAIIKVSGITINEDGADFGKVAEITVNGDNVDKTTLEMGKYVDFGVSVTAADKDLPIIYSGTVLSDEDKYVTLPVTIKENVADSWLLDTRKTTFTFPEGVDVVKVEVSDSSEFSTADSSIESTLNGGIDNNEITLDKGAISKNANKKAELELKFYLTVDAEYTGDITCTVGGPAISEEAKVTVAKAVSPIAIEAEKTSVAIDYRNVNVGDITVKEAEAGLWAKNDTITLKVDNMQFESGIKAEVVEGDGEIKDLSVNKSEGTIQIAVKSESSKTPMSIKLSNVSLYLNRSLPAGDYSLSVIGSGANETPVTSTDVMFKNYGTDDNNEKFDTKSVEFIKDYVTVATAGRDQGTTFTTEVAVTIDSTTMLVDGKEKTLDVPAYLSAEGWTMLPVRAVTEALATSSNSQPIDWIAGNPGTIMIYYGDKTVAMTLGSTTMYINGTPVPMSTAPVIVNDRAFLPMRDLGRALGLSDDQIKWDATTRTATFNPAATTTTK